MVTSNGRTAEEIGVGIHKAWAIYSSLSHLWRRHDISMAVKGKVYNAAVRSVLLYGLEKWTLCTGYVKRLSVFDHRCLWGIFDVNLRDRVSNVGIHRRVFEKNVSVCSLEQLLILH